MKLKRGPNVREPANRWALGAHLLISLPLALTFMGPAGATSSSTAAETNQTSTSIQVGDLRLVSDVRAVKLRWTYEQQAEAFDVRYCELTSWHVEIKCRTKEMPVIKHNNSVIGDFVRQLEPPTGNNYEAQVYDLRAFTNYTFQVQAARSTAATLVKGGSAGKTPAWEQRKQRRLDESLPLAASLVETKAFSAEATKCLANASEIVINTGRYFGGRISVEDSPDPRCQLIGNKSSEQTTYTFRIEHEICQSKVMSDDNRIESMILVHENKDILTHNTARFLVLCNFQQKSFTLKASVSLAKVNGQLQGAKPRPARPALITALPDGAARSNEVANPQASEPHATAVMLGSMPGFYRARANAKQLDANGADELELLNTIEKDKFKQLSDVLRNESQAIRRAKELARHSTAGSARSLALDESADHRLTHQLKAPEPVQVQSKVLYVERSFDSRSARRRSHHHNGAQQELADASRMQSKPSGDSAKSSAAISAAAGQPVPLDTPARIQRQSSIDDQLAELQVAPVIITNNHRVSADYLPLSARTSTANESQQQQQQLFRYSAAAKLAEEIPLEQHVPSQRPAKVRSRASRMRLIDEEVEPSAGHSVNRMGDAQPGSSSDQLVDLTAEPLANSTLARNITNYLLKWSLKTLTNLAKKSLENLSKQEEEEQAGETSTPLTGVLPERLRLRNQTVEQPALPDGLSTSAPAQRDQQQHPVELFAKPSPSSGPTGGKENRTRTSERSSRTGRIRLNPDQPRESSAAPWNERNQADNKPIVSSNWLLYGLGALVSLITGISLTLWLVSSSSASSRSKQVDCSSAHQNTRPGADSCIRDKYESFRSVTLSGQALLATNSTGNARLDRKTSPSSASSTSRSTSSTSVGSTSAATDETDCKNQEFLFTEHVLITGSSYGESFA